jgi:hypothetical protein
VFCYGQSEFPFRLLYSRIFFTGSSISRWDLRHIAPIATSLRDGTIKLRLSLPLSWLLEAVSKTHDGDIQMREGFAEHMLGVRRPRDDTSNY